MEKRHRSAGGPLRSFRIRRIVGCLNNDDSVSNPHVLHVDRSNILRWSSSHSLSSRILHLLHQSIGPHSVHWRISVTKGMDDILDLLPVRSCLLPFPTRNLHKRQTSRPCRKQTAHLLLLRCLVSVHYPRSRGRSSHNRPLQNLQHH